MEQAMVKEWDKVVDKVCHRITSLTMTMMVTVITLEQTLEGGGNYLSFLFI